MANTDSPFGLRPHNKLGSAPNGNGLTAYKVQIAGVAGSASAIYQGDMVIPLTNGLVDVSAADGGSVAILGVMAGCQYTNLKGKPVFDKKINRVSVKIHKEMNKFVVYIDGDRLDAYNSQREGEKAAKEFMKQYKGMK